jgi:hypothetical protein
MAPPERYTENTDEGKTPTYLSKFIEIIPGSDQRDMAGRNDERLALVTEIEDGRYKGNYILGLASAMAIDWPKLDPEFP